MKIKFIISIEKRSDSSIVRIEHQKNIFEFNLKHNHYNNDCVCDTLIQFGYDRITSCMLSKRIRAMLVKDISISKV